MAVDSHDMNVVVGRILKGEYKKRGMLLEDLAERAQIPYGTLRKKIAGASPIFVTELIALAKAMVPPLDPRAVLDEADSLYVQMSAAGVTNDLHKKRSEKEAEARAMTPDQLDQVKKRAATTEPVLEEDEPPAP